MASRSAARRARAPFDTCFASHAASRRLAPCAAEWNSLRVLFSMALGVSRSCEYKACSARWNVKRMFVRRWRAEDPSLRSLEATEVSKEWDGPECALAGVMVFTEEEEGWAEWFGVDGRHTGRRPLGVSPSSSDGFSQASSAEGSRGRVL